jgi:hypothetical protein
LGVKEAAEEGAISPFSVILVETNTDLSDVSIKKNGEYSDEELERAINIESRNRAAVQLYKQMFNGKLATVYCSSIDHAKNVMKLFLDEGVPAAVIYGQQTDKEQEDILEKFSTGEIKVLCNARILIPGFDEEGASVCLNLDPSMSAVDVEQRAGRVLRLNKHDKDKHATIVDFIDKNNNKKVQPITFAEIAGASVVYKKSSGKRGEGSGEGDGAPRPIPDIAIEGLKVTTDSEEVMRVVSKMIEEKAEKAPAGWMTENRLGKELARNPFYLRKVAGRYREENPDWFRDFIDSQGVLREHFSPDLVGIIKEILGSQEKPPAGWVHMRDLAKKLNSGYARIFNAVAQYRESHPEWFKEYLGRNGVMVEHYSPELVLKIEEALGGLEIAPEGWMVANNIARELHSSFIRVTSIADGYRINHPEWFKEYLDKKNRVGEHYSSELVLEIEKVLSSQEKVPDGWETLGFLSKQLLVSERKVKNITNKYVADHPEWFKKYVSKTGQLREYYSPELIDVIREQIALEIEPPAGWVIAKKLALEFSRGTPSIQRIADQFREGHPEWFKEYLSSNNQMIEHYSPELILEIKKILETQEKPPAGWLVRKNLSDELNQHLRKIDAIANKYRTSHPEWFHEYLDKREHMREHFSPELVEKIKEELENK